MQSFELSFLGPRCEPRPPTGPWGPARRGQYQVGRQAQAGAAAGVLGVGVGAHLQQQPHGVRLAPGHGVHQRGAPWNETCDSARAWGPVEQVALSADQRAPSAQTRPRAAGAAGETAAATGTTGTRPGHCH